jgi:chorismate--pyruvate lyase
MQKHPTWLPTHALPALTANPLHRSWLTERGSLTARLRDTWGVVSVDVITEGLTAPLPHEADRLGLPLSEPAWVRCVWLRTHGTARLYARTVIPRWGPLNPWVQVQQLGQQPLGELLFRATDLQRGAFEWCGNANWPAPDSTPPNIPPNSAASGGAAANNTAAHATSSQVPALARRCVFQRDSAPLLLTEVFLDMPLPNVAQAPVGQPPTTEPPSNTPARPRGGC